jgi:hypothetical protein
MLSHAVKIDSNKANDVVAEAKRILVDANELCQQKFQNADVLGNAMEEALRLLGKEWYEEVTHEEVAAIKVSNGLTRFGNNSTLLYTRNKQTDLISQAAMVSGSRGIATHSGHWWNCMNGHPVITQPTISEQSPTWYSLQLANAECQWSWLAVLNVALQLEGRDIEL